MPAGVQPEDLTIQHMREPGKRVPITLVDIGEGPDNAGASQAGADPWVFVSVPGIVEVNEAVMAHSAEDNPADDCQGQANGKREIAARRKLQSARISCRREFGHTRVGYEPRRALKTTQNGKSLSDACW